MSRLICEKCNQELDPKTLIANNVYNCPKCGLVESEEQYSWRNALVENITNELCNLSRGLDNAQELAEFALRNTDIRMASIILTNLDEIYDILNGEGAAKENKIKKIVRNSTLNTEIENELEEKYPEVGDAHLEFRSRRDYIKNWDVVIDSNIIEHLINELKIEAKKSLNVYYKVKGKQRDEELVEDIIDYSSRVSIVGLLFYCNIFKLPKYSRSVPRIVKSRDNKYRLDLEDDGPNVVRGESVYELLPHRLFNSVEEFLATQLHGLSLGTFNSIKGIEQILKGD